MPLTNDSLTLLKQLEGFRSTPYWDVKQWSVGYGSYAGSNNKNVKPNIKLSEAQASAMLVQQVAGFEAKLQKLLKVQLAQNQYDAVVMFIYNLGDGILTKASATYGATLLQDLNSGNFARFAERMKLYVYAGGVKDSGLVKRRAIESNLFSKGLQFIKDHPVAVGTGTLVVAAVVALLIFNR